MGNTTSREERDALSRRRRQFKGQAKSMRAILSLYLDVKGQRQAAAMPRLRQESHLGLLLRREQERAFEWEVVEKPISRCVFPGPGAWCRPNRAQRRGDGAQAQGAARAPRGDGPA